MAFATPCLAILVVLRPPLDGAAGAFDGLAWRLPVVGLITLVGSAWLDPAKAAVPRARSGACAPTWAVHEGMAFAMPCLPIPLGLLRAIDAAAGALDGFA